MFMQRDTSNFGQESEMLDRNMNNITKELSELIVATPTNVNNWMRSNLQNVEMGGSSSSMPCMHETTMMNANIQQTTNKVVYVGCLTNSIQQHASFFSNQNDLRYSYESFCRSNNWDMNTTSADTREPLLNSARAERVMVSTTTIHNQYGVQQPKRNNHSRKKFPRLETNAPPIDYDSVVIDISAIGLSTDNKEKNDVLRLFAIFRKLHYYLDDTVPCSTPPEIDASTDYPKEFIKPTNAMPCTMNVQAQIKHAIYRTNAFSYNLFDKLNNYKLVNRDRYIECSRSLFTLRKMVKQLDPFKRAEFDHKQGVFMNSFGAAQAKNLEILLLQITNKIRECNIIVDVYIWSVRKFMTQDSPSLETLKKAVAIAGAMIKNTPINETEKNAIVRYEAQEAAVRGEIQQHNNGNYKSNGGGGLLNHAAVIPMPNYDARADRYFGI